MTANITIPEPIPSSICTTGMTPHILSGMLLQLFRSHYSNAGYIAESRLKDCIWKGIAPNYVQEDPENSAILIEPVYRWDARMLQQRPGILIKRNAYKPQNNMGIGGNRIFEFGKGVPDGPNMGQKRITHVNGSHTILCIGHDAGFTDLLGTETAYFLIQYAPVIHAEWKFLRFEVNDIGELSKVEESEEHFAVPITLDYTYAMSWEIYKQEPRFAGVSLGVS